MNRVAVLGAGAWGTALAAALARFGRQSSLWARDPIQAEAILRLRGNDRYLPDKAVDLIDEAGARVKLRQSSLPEEMTDVQKRIKLVVHRMENAIANHEFEKARFYSDEERKERENLRALRDKYHLDESAAGIVDREDIEDVVSRWTGVPVTSIKEEETQKLLRVEEERDDHFVLAGAERKGERHRLRIASTRPGPAQAGRRIGKCRRRSGAPTLCRERVQ